MKKKYKNFLFIIIALIVIIILWLVFKENKPKEEYSTVNVSFGPLIQTVSEIGTIEPVQEVSLNFLNNGKISDVYVKVGDEVKSGTPLVALEKESLELKKLEARAGLEIAEANLSKILAGASNESVAVSLSEIEQAKSNENAARADLKQIKEAVAENIKQAEKALFDLESNLPETQTSQEQAIYSAQIALNNAEKLGQTAVDNSRDSVLLILDDKVLIGEVALDNLKTILEDKDVENVLGVKNISTLTNTKNSRLAALNLISRIEETILQAKDSRSLTDINQAGSLIKDFLLKVNQSLNYAYSMLEATITSADFSQIELDSYKSLVNSQSTLVSSATSAVDNSLQSFYTAKINYDTSVATAEENLRQAQVALDSAISSARNNLNNIILSSDQQVSAAQSRLDSTVKAVDLAQARLNNISAPAREQDISLAEAQVNQARAALANIEDQLANSIIIAPLSGVITQVNYSVGEQFGISGQPVVKMLADSNFEIEVDVSESDINKIKIGDKAGITLDAFSDDIIIPGVVSFIEPAQTLIQGVVYYKVKISFSDLISIQENLSNQGLSLKSGMTANVVITTNKKDNVLAVPARAVIDDNGSKIIRILENNELREIFVQTGLKGDEGLIEIREGLKEGDQVVTFIRSIN
jgi:HlyD family secretion protein